MALPNREVTKALNIFSELLNVETVDMVEFQKNKGGGEYDFQPGVVYACGKRADGWEEVCLCADSFTKAQFDLWYYRRAEVRNSSYTLLIGGKLMIGFY